jgi:hypothetical protein
MFEADGTEKQGGGRLYGRDNHAQALAHCCTLQHLFYFFVSFSVCFVLFLSVLFLFLSSAAQRREGKMRERKRLRDLWAGQRSPPSRRERLMMADQWRLLSFTILHDRINRRETNQNASQLEIENTKWSLKNLPSSN